MYTVGRGGGVPRHIQIEEYAWSDPVGQVRVRVNAADGALLPSRIYLSASDGRSYFPRGSFPRVLSADGDDYYFHTDGSFTVTLPVGNADLEVWRGFEYEPEMQTVDVRAGEWTTVDVQLDRWIDMAANGWYSGDNHIHPNYGGHERITPLDLRNKAQAEDLSVTNGLIANYWANSRVEDLEHFLGHPHPHGDERTVVYYNEEYRPNFFAHMALLNLVTLVTPFYIGYEGTAYRELYPTNAAVLEHVRQPDRAVWEMARTSMAGGLVYIELPFLQGFHASPNDYQRYTSSGVAELLREYDDVEVGVCVGPSSALSWVLRGYLKGVLGGFGRNRTRNRIAEFVAAWLTVPIKYLDRIVADRPAAEDLASGFFAFARAPKRLGQRTRTAED